MRISEIFQSIDGEVNQFYQGRLTTFIRFAGCNLKCRYCDTPQGHQSGTEMSVEEVFKKVEELGCPNVTITGGEPLEQKEDFLALTQLLADFEYLISVETNGSKELDGFVDCWVVDYKLEFPDKMNTPSMVALAAQDWIKIVVGSKQDYDRAVKVKNDLQDRGCQANFAFSPLFDPTGKVGISVPDLVKWLCKDGQWDVIVNVQIHKLVFVR